jgi:hypothetical protein
MRSALTVVLLTLVTGSAFAVVPQRGDLITLGTLFAPFEPYASIANVYSPDGTFRGELAFVPDPLAVGAIDSAGHLYCPLWLAIVRYDGDGSTTSFPMPELATGFGIAQSDTTMFVISGTEHIYRSDANGKFSLALPNVPGFHGSFDVSSDHCTGYLGGLRFDLCSTGAWSAVPEFDGKHVVVSHPMSGGGHVDAIGNEVRFYDSGDRVLATMKVALLGHTHIWAMSFDETGSCLWLQTDSEGAIKAHIPDGAIVARSPDACGCTIGGTQYYIGVAGETRPTAERVAQLVAVQIPATSHRALAIIALALIAIAITRIP